MGTSSSTKHASNGGIAWAQASARLPWMAQTDHGAATGHAWPALTMLALAYALALWQPVRAWYSDADKLVHGVVFAGVYLALAWALRWPALPLVLLSLALGAAVEAHQHFLPGFTPSLADWLADAAGVGLAAVLLTAGGRMRSRLRGIGSHI